MTAVWKCGRLGNANPFDLPLFHHSCQQQWRRATRREVLRSGDWRGTRSGRSWAEAPAGTGAERGLRRGPRARIRSLAAWTALTFKTANPVPYGADILNTRTGERLMRAANAVGPEHDPSATRSCVRYGWRARSSRPGRCAAIRYTPPAKPCAMCMACALWAGLDRVVYAGRPSTMRRSSATRFTSQRLRLRGTTTCRAWWMGRWSVTACVALVQGKQEEILTPICAV